VVLDDSSDPVEFARTVPHVLGNGNRPQSELGQTILSLDVNVVGFDAVGHEHEQPVRTSSKECRHERPREGGRRVLKVSVETHPSVIAALALHEELIQVTRTSERPRVKPAPATHRVL